MAPMFSGMYDEGIREWIERRGDGRRDGLYARDPLSGREVQLGSTVFADDVQETNVTTDAAAVSEVVRISGTIFDDAGRNGQEPGQGGARRLHGREGSGTQDARGTQ